MRASLGLLEAGPPNPSEQSAKGSKNAWRVVVLYEQPDARERAVKFCGELVDRFWAAYDFSVTWWPFELLGQRDAAREASEKAVVADLMVFAGNLQGELPPAVQGWLDAWVALRGEREGTLIGVLQDSGELRLGLPDRHPFLRHMAHRAGMDYLTEVPTDLSLCLPDSLDSYSARADRVTTLLDAILHQRPPPPMLH
jgi:hypothetical protein